jgi:TRAP transporter TAXI family solute receptor
MRCYWQRWPPAWRASTLGLVLMTGLACERQAPVTGVAASPLRIGTGARGGSFHTDGEALVRVWEGMGLSIPIVNHETAGSVANLEALQDGQTDCAFSYSDVAYEAGAGRMADQRYPFDRLRGVALVQLSPLYFLVPADSSIKSVRDLHGRNVALRSRDSGSLQAAMLVLEAFGLDPSNITIINESFLGSFARLQAGTVDAVFILTGQPSDLVTRVVADKARILPIAGDSINRLRDEYPFLRPVLILGGTYAGHDTPIRTVGIESLLLCSEAVSAERVHQLTKAWFLTASKLTADGVMSDAISPNLGAATPVPLHEGAKRYYRERELDATPRAR